MNRLANETSPYLLQHRDNPVDWYPWGDEAFTEARKRDVPVLLSVGYATCHWCHVMAHESFENPETAELMNRNFVNVKVDREERPDVDGVYMRATQALTGQGGWPMTVFLTPDRTPFYAGTYFPPRDGYGLPSFKRVLASIADVWANRREDALGNAQALTEHLQSRPEPGEAALLPVGAVRAAVDHLRLAYDAEHGGFGDAPKFPAPTTLDFLLTQPAGRDMAVHTLRSIGRGGIHDQLGGGFHRYSVDARWLVPHFEKMLYDNAQLTRSFLHAFQVTGDAEFADHARRALAYLERDLLSPEGGFYSAQDADTPTQLGGVEGLTFTWTPQELRDVLGDDADLALAFYNVTEAGNFTDPHRPEFGRRSVLHAPRPVSALAEDWGHDVQARLQGIQNRLFIERQDRPQPATDDKVLTSWNGLALAAFADAARILRDEHALGVARRNAQFIRAAMRLPDGTLRHSFKAGQAKVEGLLEDHALYALGLIALFQAGGDVDALHWARELWDVIRRDFWDESAGVFNSSGGRAETLIAREAAAFDSAVLSDNAAAAFLAVWMHRYFHDEEALALARRTVNSFSREMQASTAGFGGLWQIAAFLEAPLQELAIIGETQERASLEQVAAKHFLPFVAFAPVAPGTNLPAAEGRTGAGLAYLCVNHTCQAPVSAPQDLDALLDEL